MVRLLPAACVGILAVAAAGCDAQARTGDGSFERTLTVTGPVDLDVRTNAGGVRIDTGPSDSVRIVGRIRVNDFVSDPTDRIRQIEASPPIQQDGNTIRIGQIEGNPLFQNIRIGYEITVPAATRVHSVVGSGGQTIRHLQGPVSAVAGSGGIRVDDSSGTLEVTTGSGGLHLTSIRGEVRARAGSGGIRIDGQPLAPWDLRAGSGGITMSVDGDIPFDLDASAASGGISNDQPASVVSMSNKNRLQARIRGGGTRVELATASGGIRVH